MNDSDRRLIEEAFPLKQASLDSVHEKSVNHGHISTMHIWPARRPLAASRAALIATLLPDPGDNDERRDLVRKIGGELTEERTRSGNVKEVTDGGVLHWKRENSPQMDEFRNQIRKAFGGQPPKVLDPFAGGGAIPLEAMRLGCDVTANDLNPVAWFILKCTLDYPQKIAGETHPLPDFVLEDADFMDDYLKSLGYTPAKRRDTLRHLGLTEGDALSEQQVMFSDMNKIPEADLEWHVRAWGRWVLDRARKKLSEYYPTYAEFETVDDEPTVESDEPRRIPIGDEGVPDVASLNSEFSDHYLTDDSNPRWVAKSTVAYFWARTVPCKACRATLPLLKTQWLCRKSGKRIRLTIEPREDGSGVDFGIKRNVPTGVDSDKTSGTMSRSGATCPCCGTTMTMEDLRQEGKADRLGKVMTAVVVDGQDGKEYRKPTEEERDAAQRAEGELEELYESIPFGLPSEPMPDENALGMRAPKYGFKEWKDVFTPRQLFSLGTFARIIRDLQTATKERGYNQNWSAAIRGLTSCIFSRLVNRSSSLGMWHSGRETLEALYGRFSISMKWDFPETVPITSTTGSFSGASDWVGRAANHLDEALAEAGEPTIRAQSASSELPEDIDAIVTDPPYYDAVPYSDCMDFFYVWLRRVLYGLDAEIDEVFDTDLSPKWDDEEQDGEFIEDPSRFDGDGEVAKEAAKQAYEDGIASALERCHEALKENGRLCLVFANKDPEAWETLVKAVIRAGFVVDASWPIETEQSGGLRNYGRASLSSSIWLVCRKRDPSARPGWDSAVLDEMRENITERLRQFWDAGIRGPDFVWSATGPALEAYSKHPVVKKADEPGKTLEVSEFLGHVREEVVDFAVGRVLSQNGEEEDTAGLDSVTAYYLLHRYDFGLQEAPAGAGILYALSCGLDDSALSGQYDLVEQSGSKVSLKSWEDREKENLGKGADAPLVDKAHRLARLWSTGDKDAVDTYIQNQGLQKNIQFQRVLQALIELSEGEERSALERIDNHLKRQSQQGPHAGDSQTSLFNE